MPISIISYIYLFSVKCVQTPYLYQRDEQKLLSFLQQFPTFYFRYKCTRRTLGHHTIRNHLLRLQQCEHSRFGLLRSIRTTVGRIWQKHHLLALSSNEGTYATHIAPTYMRYLLYNKHFTNIFFLHSIFPLPLPIYSNLGFSTLSFVENWNKSWSFFSSHFFFVFSFHFIWFFFPPPMILNYFFLLGAGLLLWMMESLWKW